MVDTLYISVLCTASDGETFQSFFVHDGHEIRLEGNHHVAFPATDEDDLQKVLHEQFYIPRTHIPENLISSRLLPVQFADGEYHPRVYRPFLRGCPTEHRHAGLYVDAGRELPGTEVQYLSSVRHYAAMLDELMEIFQFIEPARANMQAYGHKTRSLLMTACTEIECQLRGVLLDNGYDDSRRLNTNDYIRTKGLLKLDQYRLNLTLTPGLPEVEPFRDWDDSRPTTSISWYDDYNATKHDRDSNYERASLGSVYSAIMGLGAVILSQYGLRHPWIDFIGSRVAITGKPSWDWDEKYNWISSGLTKPVLAYK